VAHYLKEHGYSVVIGSGDTYRAGADEQMKTHAERVGVKVIRHQHGADPSAVLFDAVQYATAHEIDVILADTAGRFHNRANLMNQLAKIRRVIDREAASWQKRTLLVLDATTGQNALLQARYFTEAVQVTGLFLAKLDGTGKGGIVFAICDQLGIPVRFVGTGERPEDLAPFVVEDFVEALFA